MPPRSDLEFVLDISKNVKGQLIEVVNHKFEILEELIEQLIEANRKEAERLKPPNLSPFSEDDIASAEEYSWHYSPDKDDGRTDTKEGGGDSSKAQEGAESTSS